MTHSVSGSRICTGKRAATNGRNSLADCDKYLAELAKEIRIRKFTLAELEEEEQSLDRLRRWCRELRGRDLLAPSRSAEGVAALRRCEEEFDGYADQVYAALGGLT